MGNNAPGQGGVPGWGQQPQEPPQAPQQQPGWGAPPPQAPQQQPGWGAPPPQAGWNPAPPAKSSGNGCLKGCLIIGGILLVLAIIVVVGISILGARIAGDMGIGANGQLKECSYVSNSDLETVLGKDATALPISGIADATIGLALDKRVLKDAGNCLIGSGSNSGTSTDSGAFGRIAKYSGGDSSSKFDAEKKAADTGGYLGDSVSGLGDQAFCTAPSTGSGAAEIYPGVGVLVRKGNDLVYVSMLDASPIASDGNFATTCELAQKVAKLVIK